MYASCCPLCECPVIPSEKTAPWCAAFAENPPMAKKGRFREVFGPVLVLLVLVVVIFGAKAANAHAIAGLTTMAALFVLGDWALTMAALVQRLSPASEVPAHKPKEAEPMTHGRPVVRSVPSYEGRRVRTFEVTARSTAIFENQAA